MAGKRSKNLPKKATFLSTDTNIEDFELIESIKEKKRLNSRREAIAVLCNAYRKKPCASLAGESDIESCDYLSDNGEVCCRNPQKLKNTSLEQCTACQKAQKLAERDRERERMRQLGEWFRIDAAARYWVNILGVSREEYGDELSRLHFVKEKLDQKDKQIEELKKPDEGKIAEIINLRKQLEGKAALETDNVHLRSELEKLKRQPLAEKNAKLVIECGLKDKEVSALKQEIARLESVISGYMFKGKQNDLGAFR
ncbi:MAG: hypothetical protein NWF05_11845 [Candidatus Bathyarchaeota archaeon]|nr:hypothetical protein [Candidatus Bathyarchaeota archaeon]